MKRTVALTTVIVASLAVHYSALSGWWLSDDPQVLVQAVRYSPHEYFFVPPVWRYLSASNFTPLVTLSFEGDLAIAGLNPRPFYIHQIAAVTIAAALLFLVLAHYTGTAAALAGAALFVVSPQAIVAARTLMVRHYVEGLVLALLSLLLWVRGRESRTLGLSLTLSVVSAVFYLLAMLAKEVYVPLPLFMAFDSVVGRERWRRLSARGGPVGFALAGYLTWRVAILGSAGGYGTSTVDPVFFSSLWKIALGPAPTALSFTLLAVLVLLLSAALLKRPLVTLSFLLIGFVAAAAVLIPVAGQLETRHGFVLFAVIAAGVALAILVAKWKTPAWIFAGAAVIVAFFAGEAVRRTHDASAKRVVAQGRYIWTAPADGPLLFADAPAWYLGGLAELRRRSGRGHSPRYVLSPEGLAAEPLDLSRVMTPADGQVSQLSDAQFQVILAERRRYLPNAPVELAVEKIRSELRWRLGPQPAARFVFLTYPDYDEYVIGPSGSRVIPEATEKQFFRIRRDLPDGRWTITPPLPLPEAGDTTRWRQQ